MFYDKILDLKESGYSRNRFCKEFGLSYEITGKIIQGNYQSDKIDQKIHEYRKKLPESGSRFDLAKKHNNAYEFVRTYDSEYLNEHFPKDPYQQKEEIFKTRIMRWRLYSSLKKKRS